MSRRRHMNAGRPGERGFILALGLLMLASLALIGTMSLSTASFQNDLANNVRVGQETYYAANYGVSHALTAILRQRPRMDRMLLSENELYMVGAFNRATGQTFNDDTGRCSRALVDPTCLCLPVIPKSDCIYYYVETELVNRGHAPTRWGIEDYHTYYYRVSSTAAKYDQGSQRRVSVFVAGVWPDNYR